ncbi:MAG: DUF885 domain-containing protein [Ramlibacter sp.]|nr:DUF885 domain-containing protein [Ramlibacter sp.]
MTKIARVTRRAFNASLACSIGFGQTLARSASLRSADIELAALAEEYHRAVLALFPLDATENTGDARYDAAFEIDISPAHRERQRALYRRTLDRLGRIDTSGLDREGKVTHALVQWDAADRLRMMAYPRHLMPLNQLNCMPVRLAQWSSGNGSQPLRTSANYENFLKRLQRLPAWIDQAISNMREGIRGHVVLPRPVVERILAQLDALVLVDLPASPYLAGVGAFPPGVPQADRPGLREAYRKTVRDAIAPANTRLRDFMRGEYLQAARLTGGLSGMAGGAGWYRLLVQSSTTTDLRPEQIHEIGLREVARIGAELEKVKADFGFSGNLAAFFQSLATRAELTPFQSDSEVLAAYTSINDRVKERLPKFFERAPRAPLEIRAVEHLRRNAVSSHYVSPALDGSRPGVFFAAFPDARKVSISRLAALFLHEGQPGHHYQVALQQETARTDFRRTYWNDAYGEGWALYAESLGEELGLYGDAASRLGRLQQEMMRALRLVIDTGIHAQGWTRERAISFARENDGSSEDEASRAVDRYLAWPGQALAYKIGELKMLELRERARARLGSRFDLRAFHTQVLEDGCLPLHLLEAKVSRWLAG